MTADYRYKCRECGRGRDPERFPALSVQRKAGGSYNRPPRWYSSSICLPCAREVAGYAELAEQQGRGAGTLVGAAKWSRTGLGHALERHREREEREAAG